MSIRIISYNWQSGTFVYGLEADISGLSKPSSLYFGSITFPTTTSYGSNVPWMATVRGRLGVTVGDGNTLLYGTGGVAIAHVKAMESEPQFGQPPFDYSTTRTGWAAGGGIERMIAPHWTVGAEALFADFGSYTKTQNDAGTAKCCTMIHDKVMIGRFKLNYKF